jgi:ribosomal protein S18 acetylase RimI-like enzyme
MKASDKVTIDGRNRIAIRRARTGDEAELLRLIHAYYRFDKIRFHTTAIGQALARLLKNRRLGSVWIMRNGIKAVGYVVLAFNFDLEFGGFEGLVTDLYIDEKYRGRGLGERAIEVVDDYCRSQGIGTVELQVVEDNEDAQAFYRRVGFTRLNRIVMAREVGRRGGRGASAGLLEEK